MEVLVNFVHGDIAGWADVAADEARDISIHQLAPRIRMGREIWLVQAFHLLRQRGCPVALSGDFDPEAINVVHCDDIRPCAGLWRYFIVSVRADRDPAFVSHLEIVQNRVSIWSEHDHYIPHWPQPGLIARDPGRSARVENVIYMGKADNLEDSFKTEGFRKSLERMGMRLLIEENQWWNYREADVVLAVRGGPRFYQAIKPAAKLVNAWMAGCPAILSPESGYTELRRSDADYLAATEPAQVLAWLSKLKGSPEFMARMITNGKERAAEFNSDAIADRWEEFLFVVAARAFRDWQVVGPGYRRKCRHYGALVRRRIWGQWAVGRHQAPWKEALGKIRRWMVLPRSANAS